MALKGIKVLELAGLAPVPFCGMILADFGASVIRIDKPNQNADLDSLANGKLSICLDLKNPKAVDIVRELSKKSDVLIEPFRPGVMEKIGLGPKVLCAENPKLIYARLTGYGQSGPYSSMAGHDINYLGISGLLSMFGRAAEKPIFPVNLASDFGGGGLMCAMGILLALIERSKSGLGQTIDANMVEGTAYLGSWLFRSQNLPFWGQERGHNLLDTGAHFYETYETKDGKYMTVGAIEPQFYRELLEKLGIDEDDLGSMEFEKGKKILTVKFLEKTQAEWCEIFENSDACVAPIVEHLDVDAHKHNKGRVSFVRNNDVVVPKPAPSLSRTPGITSTTKKQPACGEHTQIILQRMGYSDNDIAKLATEKVIRISDIKNKL